MNYREANKFLSSLINYERDKAKYQDFKLEKFKNFLTEISNPEKRLKKVILVAGTKGKGSTSTMLASCLASCGIKTGLFTSPHLLSWRERIRVNNRMITSKNFCKLLSSLLPQITKNKLTFFEALTAIAFLYFLEEDVEWAVLEVGLGGRLDATNVVSPNISVITRIGFDHTEILGDDLVSIAREKSGIIHSGSTVVTSRFQAPEVLAVIEETAKERWSKLVINPLLKAGSIKLGKDGSRFEVGRYPFFLPLLGGHQIENAELVINSLLEIKRDDPRITWEGIRIGLERTSLLARCQLISEEPAIMVDVAHNPDSCHALKEVIEKVLKKKAIFVFGVARDKKIEEMLSILSAVGDYFLLSQARHPRAQEVEILSSYAQKLGLKFTTAKPVAKAIRMALAQQKREVIVLTGSFYLVGEGLKFLKRILN